MRKPKQATTIGNVIWDAGRALGRAAYRKGIDGTPAYDAAVLPAIAQQWPRAGHPHGVEAWLVRSCRCRRSVWPCCAGCPVRLGDSVRGAGEQIQEELQQRLWQQIRELTAQIATLRRASKDADQAEQRAQRLARYQERAAYYGMEARGYLGPDVGLMTAVTAGHLAARAAHYATMFLELSEEQRGTA